jgi:hypothetical protein
VVSVAAAGRFPGSFARGLPFQENPDTGDARISGTLASLAGLEQAIQSADEQQMELAVRHILMLYSVILSIGGIPLIYLGDEVGTLNDYAFTQDPHKANDNRWVHSPKTDWAWRERVQDDASSPHSRIFKEHWMLSLNVYSHDFRFASDARAALAAEVPVLPVPLIAPPTYPYMGARWQRESAPRANCDTTYD